MKRAIVVGLAMVCLVIYLVLLNGETVDFRLTNTWIVHWNVGALIGGAFVAGVLLTLTALAIQAGRRALVAWRTGRRQRRSDRIDQWEGSGEQLIWAGDAQRGRILLQKAWQRRPQSAHAVLALAASFRDTGELHRARGVLFDAASQQHTEPNVLLALAETHRASGELAPCIEVLERLRALHPRAPRVLRALRDAYVDAERWADAALVGEAVLPEIRDPQEAAREREYLAVLRYQTSVRLSDPVARISALEGMTEGRTIPVPVLVSLGDALVAAGRPEDGSAVWERALRTAPRTVFAERLAALASETRHRDRVRAVLRKVRPNLVHADAVRLLTAQLHLADHNIDAAAHELAAVENPTAAPSLLPRLWGEVHRSRGLLQEALAAYTRAVDGGAPYHCTGCERAAQEWTAWCPCCRRWDSYRAAAEIGVA